MESPESVTKVASVATSESRLGVELIAARRRRRRIFQGVLGVIFAGLGIAYFASTRSLPTVEVLELETRTSERILAVTGRVQPRESIAVVSAVAGQLVELTKDEGDAIQQGEILGQVDNARARAALAQAEAAVEAQRRVGDQAENDLNRSRALREDGTVSEAALEAATLALTRGLEDLRRLEAAADEARANLAEYIIFAPLTGRILSRPVDERQVVTTATAIFEVAPMVDRYVETEVDEAYSMALTLGQPARMAFAGIEQTVAGEVSYLSPRIDTATGGRVVRLTFTPPANAIETELPVGLSVDVNIIVEKRDSAVTVPRNAVRQSADSPYVLVVDDGKVTRRDIVFRDWPSSTVMIDSGLESGDRLIVSAAPPTVGTEVEIAEVVAVIRK